MSNFLLLYHGGSRPEDPAEQAQVMKAWTDETDPISEIRPKSRPKSSRSCVWRKKRRENRLKVHQQLGIRLDRVSGLLLRVR